MAATEAEFAGQQPPDPDVQTTLSDFLTYTEHFPSHLTRALNLIQDQRIRAEERIRAVHNDTTTYALLPTLPAKDRPDPVELRKRISYALEDAERACRMSVEEATRLDDTAKREAARLDLVTERLKAQPMPPSRDPTPEHQQALTSPNLRREGRLGTRPEDSTVTTEKPQKRAQDKAASKLRTRKIMVPGEVLPPPDPTVPAESMSDWTSPRASPPIEEAPLQLPKATSRPRSRTPKIPKAEKAEKTQQTEMVEKAPGTDIIEQPQTEQEGAEKKQIKPRAPRQPGQTGTNAHSAVAGISTSNALLALKAPPEDAPNGSKWLPWAKLTEFEMAKLRKRMKKNAIWVPSQTMVRRELKTLGRGVAGKEAARQNAQATGEAFVDEFDQPDPTKVILSGEETAQMNDMLGPQIYDENDDADAELINRGMRLNEAKKLKRQRMLEEQALQAQIAREQGGEGAPIADSAKTVSGPSEPPKKRKRETTPVGTQPIGKATETPDPLSKPAPPQKKLKISAPDPKGSKVPLAPADGSSKPGATSRRAATPPARKPIISLKATKAVSEEPPNRRASLRRGSNASLPNASGNPLTSPAPTATAPPVAPVPPAHPKTSNRRSKRPAPGIIANGDEDSAKLLLSKRKAAPRKSGANKKSTTTSTTTTNASSNSAAAAALPSSDGVQGPDEYIDPDEPRYCVCGDVSWGTMIACDNDDCEKEWFHLTCVDLDDLPPRRTKWYCPDCRKKLKLGVGNNGMVGRGIGAGR
ncbi:hypothetical protein MBLNU230_g0383t1 [Neophaeotheca triangularis]